MQASVKFHGQLKKEKLIKNNFLIPSYIWIDWIINTFIKLGRPRGAVSERHHMNEVLEGEGRRNLNLNVIKTLRPSMTKESFLQRKFPMKKELLSYRPSLKSVRFQKTVTCTHRLEHVNLIYFICLCLEALYKITMVNWTHCNK